jgi:hypothetical protein
VLLKDFKGFAEQTTVRFRAGVEQVAEEAGQSIEYLPSPEIDKERRVDEIVRHGRVHPGKILAIFKTVECCQSYDIHRNAQQKILELRPARRKCLHYYVYLQDPVFGRAQVRMQTWFPFNVHIVINGREWLARQMDAVGLKYQRRDNCFVWVEDFSRVQALFDKQLRSHWPRQLARLLSCANPTWRKLLLPWELEPYWSAEQSEWATDIAFRSGRVLKALYPRWIQHGLVSFGSQDVMRFLGRSFARQPYINGHFQGEVVSDVAVRPEGLRIKHRVKGNTLKMYDKQGSVLRVETTINDARDLKCYRRAEGVTDGPKTSRRLRKGVADLARRAQLCDAANRRYLDALATADTSTPLKDLLAPLCCPVQQGKRRFRALHPLEQGDAELLSAITRGEFLIKGFRNADIRTLIYGADPDDPTEHRRRASRISRLFALLCAHRLIRKIRHTHRYLLTRNARRRLPAILAARTASVDKLLPAA